MRLTRIFVPGPLETGKDVVLPAQAGEHLTRVLRLEAGAPFTLFDGNGGEYSAILGERSGKQVKARVEQHLAIERESPLDITLLQGVARGERMDLIVQKATELGVTRILPVLTERSVVKLDARLRDRKREHWQAIATSACEQCGRNRLAEVSHAQALADAISSSPANSTRCLLAADAAQPLAAIAAATPAAIVLLIGPEGGLADHEEAFAQANGFISYRLGARVMRTETAGLAALATLQALAGDFRA
jgi:16S rRNA (uracil1498-N3)-methyltransferase